MTFSLLLLINIIGFGFPAAQLLNPLAGVQSSQIQGNVPKQFAKVLKRDLASNKTCSVKHCSNQPNSRIKHNMNRDILQNRANSSFGF
jgi:hypothetical protein